MKLIDPLSQTPRARLQRMPRRAFLKHLSGCAGAVAVTSFATPMASFAAEDKTIAGRATKRIAEGSPAHNAMLLMLGASDQIVTTVAHPDDFPWMYRVAPALHEADATNISDFDSDTLLARAANLVFLPQDNPNAPSLEHAGLQVVEVGFNDFPSLLDCVDRTANAIDTDEAHAKARAYRNYLEHALKSAAALNDIAHQRGRTTPRVLHVASLSPLRVDGSDTIVDAWLHAAGARNAADGVHGNLQIASMEQINAWNPDIVVLAADAGALGESAEAGAWASLDAAKARRIYRNPAGVYYWDRYGPEVALQIAWATSIFTSKRGIGRDQHELLAKRTIAFYQTFFDYTLSNDDAERILNGVAPA